MCHKMHFSLIFFPQIYLMEAGLELWLALLRSAKEYDENLHKLFPRIPQMLEDDLDHLKPVQFSSDRMC